MSNGLAFETWRVVFTSLSEVAAVTSRTTTRGEFMGGFKENISAKAHRLTSAV
jgi:hypothetical protein